MARIYKESRYVLQLLIGKSYGAQYDDVKISFYTKNPSNQVMVDNGITIKRNIAEVKIESTLFDNLEDGLIKYIVYGAKDGIPFIEERISNYFLKTPLDFKPGESGTTCNLGETEFEFGISDFADIFELYSSDEGYDGWSKVTIRFANNDWANIYSAGQVFKDYSWASPGIGNYSYVCGKITEIQEVNTSAENNYASFTLDNCFKVSKAKWNYNNKFEFEREDQIKVGDCSVVFGVFQDNNGSLQFEEGTSTIIAYQECAGGSCNLEDKWVTPSMGDRDGNNLIVVEESEGYDGLSRVVIDPQTIYNEGVEAGRAEGGGGGSCNLGTLDWALTSPSTEVKNASDDGYDGYSQVTIRPENVIAQEKESAINDFKNKMDEITITENGTYSIDDQETRQYIEFDGNSYFDTNIPFGENTKIEVAILKTTYEEDEQIIGCAHYDLFVADTYGGFGIVVGAGLAYGVFGNTKTTNIPFSVEQEQILTLDRNGIHSSFNDRTGNWEDDSRLDGSSIYGTTIGIGKIKSVSDGWAYRGLNGRIRYVKIWTNKDDDSTMTLFRPKNMAQGGFGMVNSEGTEYNYVENLGEGTATFVEELVKKYPKGFKRVEVNVPNTLENIQKQPISIDDYNALIGNYDPNVLYLIY